MKTYMYIPDPEYYDVNKRFKRIAGKRPRRQGDVIPVPVNVEEAQCEKLPHLTLAEGEVTGHSHRIEDSNAALFKFNDKMYLKIQSEIGFLRHEEHKEIQIPQGDYEVIIQQDYEPSGWKKVQD